MTEKKKENREAESERGNICCVVLLSSLNIKSDERFSFRQSIEMGMDMIGN